MMRLVVVVLAALSGVALAQSGGAMDILMSLGFDLAALGASSLVFAKAIQFAVEQVKSWWRDIPLPVVIALPFVFGVGGAFVLARTVGISDPAFLSGGWFAFGIVSALMAGGWYETQKKTALRAAGVRVAQPPDRKKK